MLLSLKGSRRQLEYRNSFLRCFNIRANPSWSEFISRSLPNRDSIGAGILEIRAVGLLSILIKPGSSVVPQPMCIFIPSIYVNRRDHRSMLPEYLRVFQRD